VTISNSNAAIALQAEDVSKCYGKVEALRGMDLTLRSGEWLGLLGPNGAGKTTLIKILAGLLPANGGHFSLLGKCVNPARSGRLSGLLGIVPQDIALYPALTAEENLCVFARLHGVERQRERQRVQWALGWTGMTGRARDRVSSFSGGMKRRLNIACAVLHEPKVLLLDEPTVGVDPQARQRIWTMLRELQKGGTSLIHSSHQLDEVESTCDRVVIIDHGRKIGEGRMDELLRTARPRPHLLILRFRQAPAKDIFGSAFSVHGTRIKGALANPARELPAILHTASEKGLELLEIEIKGPRLEDIFTEVTGKELRE
jgi:ABC-2 type transport system ATP-binding protein